MPTSPFLAALRGLEAQRSIPDLLANNVANSVTASFRRSRVVLRPLLPEREVAQQAGRAAASRGKDIVFRGGKDLSQRVTAVGSRGAKNAASKAGKAAGKQAAKKGAATAGKQAGKKAASAGSKGVPILDAAMLVSTVLELLVGPGQSEKGQDIAQSADSFEVAVGSLANAIADPASWSGEAAEAYNVRNYEQVLRTVTIVELDRQLAAIVHRQAGQVHEVSIAMTICGAVLIGAIPVAIGLRFIPIVGPAISIAFQIATSTAILAAEATELGIMGQSASDNGAQIDTLARQYRELGDNAHLNGSNTVRVPANGEQQTTADTAVTSTPSSPGMPAPAHAQGVESSATDHARAAQTPPAVINFSTNSQGAAARPSESVPPGLRDRHAYPQRVTSLTGCLMAPHEVPSCLTILVRRVAL